MKLKATDYGPPTQGQVNSMSISGGLSSSDLALVIDQQFFLWIEFDTHAKSASMLCTKTYGNA